MLVIGVIVCTSLSLLVVAQRNHEAESMCQPFLTSNFSSPLIPGIQRNLKIDEDGEYFCELVLQDRDLPPQVRVTIHEGLSYLAIRHVQMGLERHHDAFRHLKILAQMVPSNFNFNFRAAIWSLDPMIAQPDQGVIFLKEALYGQAAGDESAREDDRWEARKYYAQALGYTGDFEGAQTELLLILKHFPLDFGVSAWLKEILRKLEKLGSSVALDIQQENLKALQPSEELYQTIAGFLEMKYTGFKIPHRDWIPREYFGVIPSSHDFDGYINRREPFVIRSRSDRFGQEEESNLDSLFNWKTDQWSNMDYLRNMVGPDENIIVEKSVQTMSIEPILGFGAGSFKMKMNFLSFLDSMLGQSSGDNGAFHVLNYYDGFLRDDIWSSPLYQLRNDVPVPIFLESLAENVSSVAMWMSNTPKGRTISDRLHMEPMDSLHVVVSGQQKLTLYSPDMISSLKTVSPTYGVSPSGFSYQYNSPANLPSLDKAQMEGHELGKGYYHYSSLEGFESEGTIVELNAGDALFVPAGWYYETKSTGLCIALKYKWLPTNWRTTLALEKDMKSSLIDKFKASITTKDL